MEKTKLKWSLLCGFSWGDSEQISLYPSWYTDSKQIFLIKSDLVNHYVYWGYLRNMSNQKAATSLKSPPYIHKPGWQFTEAESLELLHN